jgi:hypothetical protein
MTRDRVLYNNSNQFLNKITIMANTGIKAIYKKGKYVIHELTITNIQSNTEVDDNT